MSVMNMWTICDRCYFEYRRRYMRKEKTGMVVCEECYDGKYDLVSHPQNRPPRPRAELRTVPDARNIEVLD